MSEKKSLSRERIIGAAVRLVDEGGLDALSMRGLGRELGVEAMSLYRYIDNKEDLLDGVHGAILSELEFPAGTGSWRERVAGLARAFRRVLFAHPNAIPLFTTRAPAHPASWRLLSQALALLEEAGFPPTERLGALHAVMGYVLGTASVALGWQNPDRPRVDYATLDPEQYPQLHSLAAEIKREDPGHHFELGLKALLDGLEKRAEG